MADVEMKPVDKKSDKDTKDTKDKEESSSTPAAPSSPASEIKTNLALIHRGVISLEPRFTNRVLRSLNTLRKKLNGAILRDVIGEVYAKGMSIVPHASFTTHVDVPDASTKDVLITWVSAIAVASDMDVDSAAVPSAPKAAPTLELVPESEIYIRLLIIHQLLKEESSYPKAKDLANETVEKIAVLNRRSMDPIAARVWYALERAYEVNGTLAQARPYVMVFHFWNMH
jgi:26S proteasome regulatory subunit N3